MSFFIFRFLDFWIFGFLEWVPLFWFFGFLELHSPKLWFFGFLEFSKTLVFVFLEITKNTQNFGFWIFGYSKLLYFLVFWICLVQNFGFLFFWNKPNRQETKQAKSQTAKNPNSQEAKHARFGREIHA